ATGTIGSGLTKLGAGTLTLTGTNTFTGTVAINEGVLAIGLAADTAAQAATRLGAANTPITLAGGTLRYVPAIRFPFDADATNKHVFTLSGTGGTFDTPSGQFEIGNTLGSLVAAAGATLTKTGSGTLRVASANAGFDNGAFVVLNAGVIEAGTATTFGTSAQVTVNGGNFAAGANFGNPVALAGGALSPANADRVLPGAVSVGSASSIFLNDWYGDTARSLTLGGKVSGAGGLTVGVSRGTAANTAQTLFLTNATNDFSGPLTIQKNLRVNTAAAAGIGSTIGTAPVTLAGGQLYLKDNGTGSNLTLAYGNNVAVVAPAGNGTTAGTATIDVNLASGTTTLNNTFRLGTLAMAAQTLNVTGANGYGLAFNGLTTLSGNATFNTTTAPLSLDGGVAGAFGVTKTGAAGLALRGLGDYTGATTISLGTLTVGGAAGRLTNTSSLTFGNGAGLVVDNNTAGTVADRVRDAAPIAITNGSIVVNSEAATATTTDETVGALTIAGATNTITVNRNNAGAIAALTLASIARANADAAVRFAGTSLGQAGITSRIIIGNQADTTFIGGWATVGTAFAAYSNTVDSGFKLGVYAAAQSADPTEDQFVSGANVVLTGNTTTTLAGNRAINSLSFANAAADTRTLDLGGNSLVLEGGGLSANGGGPAVLNGAAPGALTAGTTSAATDLFVTNDAALSVGAGIRNNDGGGAVRVIKAGTGVLTLGGASTFTGDFVQNQGTVSVADVANAGLASNLGAGSAIQLSGQGNVTTFRFTGPTDATNRPLSVGTPGSTFDVTTAASTLTLSGPVTVAGPFTKVGTGTLALGGTATFGGGDVNVGLNGVGGTLAAAAGSTVTLGSGSATNLNIGSRNNGVNTPASGTVDATAAAGLTVNVANVRVEVDFGTQQNGVMTGALRLPTVGSAVNSITATSAVTLGSSPQEGNTTTTATLALGGGTTTITTPTLTVGGTKSNGLLNIGAGGTLTLNNGGTNRTALTVGSNPVDTGSTPVSTATLAGGTLTANLGAVLVGNKSGGGNAGRATGTLNLGSAAGTNVNIAVTSGSAVRAGILDLASGNTQPTSSQGNGTVVIGGGTVSISSTDTASSAVVLGNFTSALAITGTTSTATPPVFTPANNAVTGTLTISGGAVTISSGGTANAIVMGARSTSGTGSFTGTNASTGTLNLSGGSLTVNNAITGNNNAANFQTSNLNLSGGLLNMQGKNVSSITTFNFTGGTLRNLGTLNQGLTQTGATSLLEVTAADPLATATISGNYAVAAGAASVADGKSLSIAGNLALDPSVGGTLGVTLNGTANGKYAATGTVGLTSTTSDVLSLSAPAGVATSTAYVIATHAGYAAGSDTDFEQVLVNGLTAQGDPLLANYVSVAYNPTNITVTVNNVAAVPEPTAVGAAGLAAAGLLARRRRRRTA
ncbi:MAG: hypothetical protein JWO31_2950, partial [Phycisphaerales bacterium]|nr:hypothetical protein [Phycisphaerales bacterium]